MQMERDKVKTTQDGAVMTVKSYSNIMIVIGVWNAGVSDQIITILFIILSTQTMVVDCLTYVC